MFGTLLRRYKKWLILAMCAGVASGLGTSGLIAFVNHVFMHKGKEPHATLWFLLLAASVPIGRVLAQGGLTYVAELTAADLRLQLSRDILACELRALEDVGHDRLMTVLVDDVGTITGGLIAASVLCTQLAVLSGCFVYLLWLSWTTALALATVIVLGMTSVQMIIRSATRYYELARKEENDLFKYLRSIVQGAKELKLHESRKEAFLTELLEGTSKRYQRHVIHANTAFAVGVGWGQLLFFMLLAGILFVLPRVGTYSQTITTGYLITLLYLMTPLDVIGSLLPSIGRTGVALRNIDSLGLSLKSHGIQGVASRLLPPSESIEFRSVTYAYHENGSQSFEIGPIDLTIHSGELVFITGGNGSGKTTLMKLLVGLYTPDSGAILCNRQLVTANTGRAYREQFSAVFSDYHLFEELLGLDRPDLDEEAAAYIDRLDLKGKLRVREGKLSTIDLSQGQRKRLALLTAYLEGRPVYVFDEWAADQDPRFKAVFYHELLGDLKRKGKTVVVISHDDRFYHVADQVYKLEDGRIQSVYPHLTSTSVVMEPSVRVQETSLE